ncbi:MAG: DUF3365 domain-containing protein [Flavobacteriaceae bacterium]
MKVSLFFMVMAMVFTACKDNQKLTAPINEAELEKEGLAQKVHPGKQIMEQECYVCHHPKASMADRIAPPMEAIKRHYIDSGVTKEAFTKDLIRWVNDPTTETKMPGAHARFGPMPYMPIPDDAVAQIADYIYDNELEQPEWFDNHFRQAHRKGSGMRQCDCFDYPEPEDQYAAIGSAYAREAKKILGRNLKEAIMQKGPSGAIGYCKTEATKLTDSISLMRNAVIKRVTDKARNPVNKANRQELQYIQSFKNTISSNKDIEPIVQIDKGEVHVYLPITTTALCLQCHGSPKEQITPETLTMLESLYPNDEAIGYGLNEVRGMWSINFAVDR